MRQLFVDTSAWDAIADSNDSNHQRAMAFKEELAGPCHLVVTNYILDELYTLLLLNLGYRHTVDFKIQLDVLERAGILEVIWVSEEIAAEAWDVFEQFNADKQWSFTDCVSYVTMQRRGLNEAFTFDRHFQQMGFLCHPGT